MLWNLTSLRKAFKTFLLGYGGSMEFGENAHINERLKDNERHTSEIVKNNEIILLKSYTLSK